MGEGWFSVPALIQITKKIFLKVRQTQQQRRTKEPKISEDGKYEYKAEDLEIIPGLHAKIHN